ncbi:DGL1 [Auxenochlorella protothecoides x Auxenochlorella symbiontica]
MARPLIMPLMLLACCVLATSASQSRVLVLMDEPSLAETHSRFLGGLRAQGHDLDVQPIDAASLRLVRWGDWIYDKLVILGGRKGLGGALDVALVLQFFDAGHDVILALDPAAGPELRELASELGVDVDAAEARVLDHSAYDGALAATAHDVVHADVSVGLNRHVFPAGIHGPILFSGAGLSVSPESSTAFVALNAGPTAYGGEPGKAVTVARLAGRGVGLVALIQARNNARAAVTASLDLLSDAFFSAQATSPEGKSLGSSANEAAVDALARWALSQRGVLIVRSVSHRVVGGEVEPERYRVKDEVEFSVRIDRLTDGEVAPYAAEDVQVELTMLDPHVRATLTHDGAGTFSARVTAPDAYGVFKWVLSYRRRGLTGLELSRTVPIRPFAHNEYERFIFQAYPYYGSIFSLMAAFLATGAAFLYTK